MTGLVELWGQRVRESWEAGGWLMLPLFVLTIFIYFTALELFLRLNTHALLRAKVHRLAEAEIQHRLRSDRHWLRVWRPAGGATAEEVERHFLALRSDHLSVVNRRIRFLAVLATTGPLVGLLGTVTGMLATFEGMATTVGTKFEIIIDGISEALVTTQAGLIVSIPALVLVSLLVQRRNALVRCLRRLESHHLRLGWARGGIKAAGGVR